MNDTSSQTMRYLLLSLMTLSLIAAEPTEVVVIGTTHFMTDGDQTCTPAHLRWAIDQSRATMILVEAPANLPDPWSWAPWELEKVTRPYASERKLRIEPIDWQDPSDGTETTALINQASQAGHREELKTLEEKLAAKLQTIGSTFASINSPAYDDAWRSYHAEFRRLIGKDSSWDRRNDHIVDNIRKLCGTVPDSRVVVVIGAAHRYYLLDHLAGPQIRLMDPKTVMMPTGTDLTPWQRPQDLLLALRTLNFPFLAPAEVERQRANLDRLAASGQFPSDLAFFEARWCLHAGRHGDALTRFSALANERAVLAFDGTSPIGEAAQVLAAVANYRLGNAAAARASFTEIAGTRSWARKLLAEIGPGAEAR
jgi:hypothetical protein